MGFSLGRNKEGGFTLVELLIVVGVLSIISVAVILVLNPAEILKQSRDTTRLNQLSDLHRAIGVVSVEPGGAVGNPNTIYTSLPDTSATCANLGLPAPPSGWTHNCVTSANLRNVDGTGWIPINFTLFSGGSPLSVLPIDPLNTTSTYYTYVTGASYAVTTALESQKHLRESAMKDGGTDGTRVELGSNLNLWAQASGLQGYWKFDESGGTTARDSSGNNNHGTILGSPTSVTGKVGQALNFDGVDDEITIPTITLTTNATIEGWFYWSSGTSSLLRDNTWVAVGWILGFNYFGELRFRAGGTGFGTGQSVSSLQSGWHHYAFSKNGANVIYYLDGAQIATGDTAGSTANVFPWHMMRNGSGPEYIGGQADEIRIYNRSLSAQEIQAYYSATK